MKNTTLCYIENDGAYLMMHRVKKKNDMNHDKWIGVGGKFEDKESPEDCILRECYEETGLTLTSIHTILPDSFNCVGITNEKSCVILGTAEGEFAKSTSDEEEIECRWYTREEVRRLIREEAFSARVQMFCYFWSHADRT